MAQGVTDSQLRRWALVCILAGLAIFPFGMALLLWLGKGLGQFDFAVTVAGLILFSWAGWAGGVIILWLSARLNRDQKSN